MLIESSTSLMTDGEHAFNTSRIQDMPEHLRPREKLVQHGPTALTDDELLALFISSGTRGNSAIEIGTKLLRKYGSIAALGSLSTAQLAKEKGLGLAKASKLAAAFELGSRVAKQQLNRQRLDTPEEIHSHFAPQLAHLPYEQVIVALLDTRLCHLGTELVSKGTLNQSTIHPREVFLPAITRSAFGFILIHNHPSGDPSPSHADKQITTDLVAASKFMQINMIDHIIIGKPAHARAPYFSFREAGLLA